MPGIARKVLICAAVDGLIIQPLSTKGQRPFKPVQIKYADTSISSVPRDQIPDLTASDSSFEAFGVIGKLPPTPCGNMSSQFRLNHRIQAQLPRHHYEAETGSAGIRLPDLRRNWCCRYALYLSGRRYHFHSSDSQVAG